LQDYDKQVSRFCFCPRSTSQWAVSPPKLGDLPIAWCLPNNFPPWWSTDCKYVLPLW
jgi:hypothetical protein